MTLDALRFVRTPIFEIERTGAITPNPIFHRPLDQLHSRCVEYPFCASQVRETDHRILDIGSAKADKVWLTWLESLPMEVHAVDYDAPDEPPKNVHFVCTDVRRMPYRDDWFDSVLAVSVIEHIGLADPQVRRADKPNVDQNGDLDAVREIARVLKPGGRLIMTLPFGRPGLILRNQARSYDRAALSRFESVLQPAGLEVFAYGPDAQFRRGRATDVKRAISSMFIALARWGFRVHLQETGAVTWKKVPIESCSAVHRWHVDAVVCGVWTKPSASA